MTYQARQFTFNASQLGRGTVMADQINQFLSLNPTLSPIEVTTSWREGHNKASQLTATLLYRLGGPISRWWCFELVGGAYAQPEDQLAYFLANNPTLVPTIITQVGSQSTSNRWRRLLVMVADQAFAQLGATHRGIAGSPSATVAAAAYGTFYDKISASRPPTAALNIGNGIWPIGGINFLVPGLSNNPNYHQLAGVAPLCQGVAFTPPAPTAVVPLCGGCFPTAPDGSSTILATTTGTGTTTSTSSTTTSTSTTTTSTTTTSTTSTSTTSTTSTTTTSTTSTTTTSTTTTAAPGNGVTYLHWHCSGGFWVPDMGTLICKATGTCVMHCDGFTADACSDPAHPNCTVGSAPTDPSSATPYCPASGFCP